MQKTQILKLPENKAWQERKWNKGRIDGNLLIYSMCVCLKQVFNKFPSLGANWLLLFPWLFTITMCLLLGRKKAEAAATLINVQFIASKLERYRKRLSSSCSIILLLFFCYNFFFLFRKRHLCARSVESTSEEQLWEHAYYKKQYATWMLTKLPKVMQPVMTLSHEIAANKFFFALSVSLTLSHDK